jgi:integron integrase
MSEESNGSAGGGEEDKPPRLLEQVHQAIRRRHFSRRTEEAYVHWIKRFIYFSGKRHPRDLGEAEVTAFLNHLAVDRKVAGGTQNQALSALLFLYREVLGMELGWLEGVERVTRPPRMPTVLTRAEVERVLAQLHGPKWLIASLLYGSGLRVLECLRLRVKDVDLGYRQILVRDGKGEKDRVTMLPEKLIKPLRAHLERVRGLHGRDLRAGYGEVHLPYALGRKYPRAGREWRWQYLFPSADPFRGSGRRCDPQASSRRVGAPARGEGSAARGRDRQARELPYVAPLIRHASARGRLRHPHRAGAARALRRVDDHDLHTCAQQGRARSEEPARSARAAARRLRL